MFFSLKEGMDKELRVLVVIGAWKKNYVTTEDVGTKCSEVKTEHHQEQKKCMISMMVVATQAVFMVVISTSVLSFT